MIFNKFRLLFILFILTLFSIIVYPGYEVFISDHELYIPIIQHNLDPDLFSNDLISSFNMLDFTMFDEIIVFLMGLLNNNIFLTLILMYIITRLIFFYA